MRTKNIYKAREEILSSLYSIPPLSAAAQSLLSLEGFLDYYFQLEPLYPTRKEAYEALEYRYEMIFGRRRYSDWKAFRVVQSRYLRSLQH